MITLKVERVRLKELFKYPYDDDEISLLEILTYPIYLCIVFFIALILVPLLSIKVIKK